MNQKIKIQVTKSSNQELLTRLTVTGGYVSTVAGRYVSTNYPKGFTMSCFELVI